MFQETIVEIIERIESLTQKKRSIIELDIVNIKEEIQETLFNIDFTEDTIDDLDLEEIKKLNVTPKEALGVFFLTFVSTLRYELSYNSFWVGIADALLEFEEDDNRFFIENYFIDENEPNSYLNEAIIDAIIRFNLRDGYDNGKPTDSLLLQMGILNRFTNLNYWLTDTSKNSTIEKLTNRRDENFSNTFFKGWKVIQRYSQGLLSREKAINFLENNIWFKDFDFDELFLASKVKLHTPLISQNEIENNFFLESITYQDNQLQFDISADDFYILNLTEDYYDVFVDGELLTKLVKKDDTYTLEKLITIKEPENYKVKIEIKKEEKLVYQEDFILFDFNHDILIFDENGTWYKDQNQKLDDTKTYSLLIDSDFEIDSEEENIHEYFDGYVHLITNITKESNIQADDGDEYQFSLNFEEQIKAPKWLNNLELYAMSDFLSFDEPLQYNLRYNNITVSARQNDELIDIKNEMSIVRWSYTGGVIYDLNNIENYTYEMDLTYDILLNRKNTIKIKIDDKIFTKQLNVTIIEKTIKPKYRTFLKNGEDTIVFLKETNKLKNHDIENNQLVITSFHEDFITQPELKTQILRDKTNIFDTFEINKPFTLTNYPYYTEEISSVKKIYDDVQWNTFCSIEMHGIVKEYLSNDSTILLEENLPLNSTLVLLDNKYTLKTKQIDTSSKKLQIPTDTLGFCIVNDGNYLGSYFIEHSLDIETVFASAEILKFLRASYFPFAKYFNGTEYEKNRALREKARNEKKKEKRLMRACIKNNPILFLQAFIEEELTIENTKLNINFDHSKTMAEQILFAIEFEKGEATTIVNKIILNRWQNKMIEFPLFLIFLLNVVNNNRYYEIFLDELEEEISEPTDVNEEFITRMINALLSDHKIDRFEKINIKTITQSKNKDFYIKKAINTLNEKGKTI